MRNLAFVFGFTAASGITAESRLEKSPVGFWDALSQQFIVYRCANRSQCGLARVFRRLHGRMKPFRPSKPRVHGRHRAITIRKTTKSKTWYIHIEMTLLR
jgi:hypothetical protein